MLNKVWHKGGADTGWTLAILLAFDPFQPFTKHYHLASKAGTDPVFLLYLSADSTSKCITQSS